MSTLKYSYYNVVSMITFIIIALGPESARKNLVARVKTSRGNLIIVGTNTSKFVGMQIGKQIGKLFLPTSTKPIKYIKTETGVIVQYG